MKNDWTARIITDLAEVAEVEPAWNALGAESDVPDVFATCGFVRAWWRAYQRDRALRITVVSDPKGRIRLIAPFYAEAEDANVWHVIGSKRADYCNLVFSRGDMPAVTALMQLLGRQDDCRMLVVKNIPVRSTLAWAFRLSLGPASTLAQKVRLWLDPRRPLVYKYRQKLHPHISGEALTGMSNVLEGTHNRRKARALAAGGKLEYRCVTDRAEIRRHLPALFELHTLEWAGRAQQSMFEEAQNRRFYEYLVEDLPESVLRLDLLLVDDAVVAAHFGFTYAGRVYYYKACYSLPHSHCSPGKLLLGYILEWANQHSIGEIDLLKGNEAYKGTLASDVRETVTLEVYLSRRYWLQRKLSARPTSGPLPAEAGVLKPLPDGKAA